MINDLFDDETKEMWEELADEFEKYKDGQPNNYDGASKKVRKWCKNYKWGFNKTKIPIPFIEKIIKKIADDKDILEELLDASYEPFNKTEKEWEELAKKLGFNDIDSLEEIFEDLEDFNDLDYFSDDSLDDDSD